VRPSRAVRARRFASRSPLACSRPTGSLAVAYRARENRWWLWWPCADCGGVEVPLLGRPSPGDVQAVAERLRCRTCPECETRRRRGFEGGLSDPVVWYDTRVEDWVLQPPGCRAILPLEIEGFDAPEVVIYRAASDIVHLGDAFDSGL
jgi:hypothetical protein